MGGHGAVGFQAAPTKDLADPFAADPETSISSVSSVGGNDGFQYATLSRVRKFEVDGKFVQTKISHIVDVTGHMTLRDNKRYQQIKKQDLHEMRQMQRVEMKEATEFFVKMKATLEQNEKSFGEKMEVWRNRLWGRGYYGLLSWRYVINTAFICVIFVLFVCACGYIGNEYQVRWRD